MSVTASKAPDSVSLLRLTAGGTLAVVGPLAVGVGIALLSPERRWTVRGFLPALGIWLALAASAAVAARVAGALPLAVGALGGLAFAIGSFVREGSAFGVVLSIAAGLLGGSVAKARLPRRLAPYRGPTALFVVAVVLGTPIGLWARVGPGQAARSLADGDVLGVSIQRAPGNEGHVFVGSRAHPFVLSILVRIVRRGIGGWKAEESFFIPQQCAFPEGTDGMTEWGVGVNTDHARAGVLVDGIQVERACSISQEHVVVGVAPRGTVSIEGTTGSGKNQSIDMDASGAYVVDIGEYGDDSLARVAFLDRRGSILDSRALGLYEDYTNIQTESGLRPTGRPSRTGQVHDLVASRYVLTPSEYRTLCHREPPYGEGFVTITIVQRNDGVSREVVVGSGYPTSSYHPNPDPPYVHPATKPCFLAG